MRFIFNKKIKNHIYKYAYTFLDKFFVKYRNNKDNKIPKIKLRQINIKKLKVILDRESLLNYLPKGGVCAEIGVYRGDFSRKIIDKTSPSKLHLIDMWEGSSGLNDDLIKFIKKRFRSEITKKRIEINIGKSVDMLRKLPDNYFDWVYLDTDHSYSTTKKELKILRDKVKSEGIIAGHDYIMGNWMGNYKYGVIEAVNEFCVNYNWEFVYLTVDINESPSFAIKKIK